MVQFSEFKSLDEGRGEVEKVAYMTEEVHIPSMEITITEEDTYLQVEGQGLTLTKSAMSNLKYHCGIAPRAVSEYLDDPELVSSLVNHSLSRRGGHLRVIHDGVNVVGLENSDKPYIDPLEVYDIASNVFNGDAAFLEATPSPTHGTFNIKFLSKIANNPAEAVGDLSHCGVSITTNGKVHVEPYVYRMVCTNGMVTDAMSGRSSDIKKEGQGAITERLIRDRLDESKKVLDAFVALSDKVIENPMNYVARLCRELRVSDRIARVLIEEAQNSDLSSMYDIVNMVTAQGVEFGDSRYDAIGGQMVNAFSRHRCTHCKSTLA